MLEINCIYQNEAMWKDIPLGYQKEETIGSWGGLLTAMTMVLNSFDYEETPQSLNEKLKSHGGFLDALAVPAMLPILFPRVKYKGYEDCENDQAPLDRIDAALENGYPVIAQVDWNPSAGIYTHWVVLKGRVGEDYQICDPFRYRGDRPEKELLLSSRYKTRGTDPASAITAVLWLEALPAEILTDDTQETEMDSTLEAIGPEKQQDQETPDEQTDDQTSEPAVPSLLVFVPTVEGVAFRSEPIIKLETEIRRLALDDQLISVDPAELALGKLGHQGQWIHVKDQNDVPGYVAAWYVKIPG